MALFFGPAWPRGHFWETNIGVWRGVLWGVGPPKGGCCGFFGGFFFFPPSFSTFFFSSSLFLSLWVGMVRGVGRGFCEGGGVGGSWGFSDDLMQLWRGFCCGGEMHWGRRFGVCFSPQMAPFTSRPFPSWLGATLGRDTSVGPPPRMKSVSHWRGRAGFIDRAACFQIPSTGGPSSLKLTVSPAHRGAPKKSSVNCGLFWERGASQAPCRAQGPTRMSPSVIRLTFAPWNLRAWFFIDFGTNQGSGGLSRWSFPLLLLLLLVKNPAPRPRPSCLTVLSLLPCHTPPCPVRPRAGL